MNLKTIYSLVFVSSLFISCGGGGSTEVAPTPPGQATLIFPEQNSECNEGTKISDTESSVVFDWSDAQNASSYEVTLKNLSTGTTSKHTSTSSEKAITINRATPYSWFVVSKNDGGQTSTSSTWKFYNAGEAVSSHIPFPADLVKPAMGTSFESSTTTVTLEWSGEDIDNDIKDYTILMSTTTPPTNTLNTTSATSIEATVSTKNTYYWRVVTTDNEGNTSNSEIFEFKIK
ncbi:hypothetical protein [uncultured Tenacibaculum sp.]|uniref:hypothetical protein n=1 Tax=uncultured Tenacibaculum sp. TaxID=174713 RepID=UPI0026360C05|nr:hypothetical protein [uncultured Tenacibaculum sp.]